MVKRINSGSKLIPVVIDDCEVPECLHSTVWQRIKNINNYDEDLDRIIMSIFGHSEKPPLGQPPAYVNTVIDVFPNLTKVDSIILKVSCEMAIANNSEYMITASRVLDEVSKYGVSKDVFLETLDILDGRGYIKATRVLSGDIPIFNITVFGINEYVKLYVKDFPTLMENVCFHIVNNQWNNLTIAAELHKPIVMVNHAFNLLEQRGLDQFQRTLSGGFFMNKISPELNRILTK
jgi:hypothetical protein